MTNRGHSPHVTHLILGVYLNIATVVSLTFSPAANRSVELFDIYKTKKRADKWLRKLHNTECT